MALAYHLAKSGRTTVTWDVEPVSCPEVEDDTSKIAGYIREQTRPDSIILLHPMYEGRGAAREAIGGIVRDLKDEGYRFASVSELLGSVDRS